MLEKVKAKRQVSEEFLYNRKCYKFYEWKRLEGRTLLTFKAFLYSDRLEVFGLRKCSNT